MATGISLVLGLPAAYSIAKYRQGRIGILILVARMTPFVSYLLPWCIIFCYLNLIDTYTALTITQLIITLPMVIWLMISFFESVPVAVYNFISCGKIDRAGMYFDSRLMASCRSWFQNLGPDPKRRAKRETLSERIVV